MMWFIKALILLVAQTFCLTLVIGLNCSNQCCYYYHGVPANVTSMPCNPDGSTITWECLVYSPHDPDISLSVKWYRSTLEVPVREEGELITEMKGGRYAFSVTQATSPLNDSQNVVNGLFLDIFQFTINSYDSSIDRGYYWCQMVVNDTIYLQPSDIGCLMPSSTLTRNCSFSPLDFTAFKVPQVCARRLPCTRKVTTTEAGPLFTSTQSQGHETTSTSTLSMTTAASNNIMSESGTMTVIILYGVIGVLVFIIVLLLLVIVAFTVYTIRNRRAFEIKQKHDHGLDVKDPLNQLLYSNDQFIQSGDHTASTEIIHRLEIPREREESLPSTHSPQPGAPPPNSSPPQPPTTPTDNLPQPKSDNPISFSRSSSKTDDKDANNMSNPHYTEVRITTDHNHCPLTLEGNRVTKEKSERNDNGSSKTEYDGSDLTTQQHPPHSEAEEIAQINNSHRDQIKNQESHRIHTEIDVSSEYAVIEKSKKTSKPQSDSMATRADSAMENPEYKLKQDRPTKYIDTDKKR